jgi:hypothetical protein
MVLRQGGAETLPFSALPFWNLFGQQALFVISR